MLVRFNNLKIILNILEAKPGGNLSAMLSPYLFSNNMNDFCKKFIDQMKIYNELVYVTVYFFCDISEKFYTFFIKGIPIIFFFHYQIYVKKRMSIIFIFDFVLYIINRFKLKLYIALLFVLSILRTYSKRRYCFFTFYKALNKKINLYFH